MSGSANKSSSGGKSKWSSSQNVWAPQGNALTDIYGQAKSLYQQFDPSSFDSILNQTQDYGTRLAERVYPAWDAQLAGGSTTGAASGTSQQLIDSLNNSLRSPSNTGLMYQSIVGGPGNTYIDPMVAAMKSGTIDSLNRQLPQLDSQAIAAGQMGSSRHGIAEGLARSDAQKYMMDQEAQMRAGAYDTDLNWKMDIARLADSNIAGAQDRAIGLMNAQNMAQQNAIGMGEQMYGYNTANLDAAKARINLPWEALGNYSNIVGDPTVLTTASGKGAYSGNAMGGGINFGK